MSKSSITCLTLVVATPHFPRAWYPEQHKLTENVYTGIIIEESLIDSKYMDGIEITKTEIAHGGKWTLKTVNITKEKIQYGISIGIPKEQLDFPIE